MIYTVDSEEMFHTLQKFKGQLLALQVARVTLEVLGTIPTILGV